MEEFTLEEIEYINNELKEAEELQKRNGNRLYSEKEVWEIIKKLGTEEEICIE